MASRSDNSDPGRALQAAVAQAQKGVFTDLESITRALTHADRAIRLEAAYCCMRIGFSAALDPLCHMARADPASENRAQAIYGLWGIGRPSAVPAIVEALGDDEDECREAARTVLYRILGTDVLPLLGDEGDQLDPTESRRAGTWWAARAHRFDDTRVYAFGELAQAAVFIARLKPATESPPDAYLNMLHDWTGQDFGESPLPQVISEWEKWWAKNKSHYEAGKRCFYSHPVP